MAQGYKLVKRKVSDLAFDQAILYRQKKFLHLSNREEFTPQQVLYK